MQTSRTLSQVLNWEAARVGLSGLPREWTPGNWTNAENDCAVFQSTAFYGDQRNYVVSQFYNDGKAAGQLVPTARIGALACFRWPGSGDNFDHIGLVTSPADSNGNFQTIEANTSGTISGHQVARKVRPTAYVVGFVMPQYAPESGTATAGAGGSPLTVQTKGNKMKFWHDTSGTVWYGAYPIPGKDGLGEERYKVLVRYDTSLPVVGKLDTFNATERDWIKAALKANGMK